MAARSPLTRRGFRKPMKILDYGEQECMNAINNNTPKVSVRKQAEAFGVWLRKLLDEDRNDIGLYLADDCMLRWFGRTVKSKKDVSGFLKYDMSFSIHHFVSIRPGDASKKEIRSASNRRLDRSDDAYEVLATPIADITPNHIIESLLKTPTKSPTNKRTRSASSSPEIIKLSKKKLKNGSKDVSPGHKRYELRSMNSKKNSPEHGGSILDIQPKRSILDSPSTSDIKPKVAQKGLDLSYLPRFQMEAECILKFGTNKSKKGAHLNEWERQCKLEVAYSENPVCKGEYIIWTIVYTDNNRCRRNLLPDFEAVSRQSESVGR